MAKKINPEALTFILALMGIIFGLYAKDLSLSFSFVGEIFLLLLKVLIVPLIMSSIFLAVTNLALNDLKNLGVRTLIYYLATSAIASIVALTFANLIGFGETTGHYEVFSASDLQNFSFATLLKSFFPGNIIKSISEGNIIQLITFTFLFSFGTLAVAADRRKPVLDLALSVQDIIMVLIHWIIKYIAPFGVCSLVAALIAKTDTQVFAGFTKLFVILGLGMGVHALITLPAIGYFIGKFNPYKFYYQVREALIVALTTASSAATLPLSMKVIQKTGVKEKTSDFILPIGATLNMDGSAVYQSVLVLYMGEMAGMQLVLSQQILVFFFVLISSAGTAGVPNGGIVMMGAVMTMLGLPLEYLGIYILVDRLWDYPTTMLNVMGDLVGAKTVDRFVHE